MGLTSCVITANVFHEARFVMGTMTATTSPTSMPVVRIMYTYTVRYIGTMHRGVLTSGRTPWPSQIFRTSSIAFLIYRKQIVYV